MHMMNNGQRMNRNSQYAYNKRFKRDSNRVRNFNNFNSTRRLNAGSLCSTAFMKFDKILEELISLLLKSSENHWAKYFTEVLHLYSSGHKNKAYKKVLRAYGGMCSFNDLGLNFITNEEYERVLEIRKWLYNYSRSHKKGVFGF